jgi:hypothetical protein
MAFSHFPIFKTEVLMLGDVIASSFSCGSARRKFNPLDRRFVLEYV